MTDQVGGTEWLSKQREAVRAQAQDQVSRIRMSMRYRILPVIEPLPPMTEEQSSST
jgi:hypothetical protein